MLFCRRHVLRLGLVGRAVVAAHVEHEVNGFADLKPRQSSHIAFNKVAPEMVWASRVARRIAAAEKSTPVARQPCLAR
jgi:hypothetical protein